jgi:hypothetical protein
VIALMKEADPTLTRQQIMDLLRDTARRDPNTEGDLGSWDWRWGFGKLDAYGVLGHLNGLETLCWNGQDDDGDGAVDCLDSDCGGLICGNTSDQAWVPTDDRAFAGMANGNPLWIAGEPEIVVSGSPSTGGETSGHFTFESLPEGPQVSRAVLRLHYRTTNDMGNPVAVHVSPGGCSAVLEPSATFTTFDCDVTDAVQDWFSSNTPPEQRTLRVAGVQFPAAVVLGAMEGPGENIASLLLSYYATCSADQCSGL